MRKLFHLFLAASLVFCISQARASNIAELSQEISDSLITTKITTKFTKNVNLNPLKIFVSTEHGVVTLKGYVKNKHAFVEALRLVRATKGVKSVDVDNLEIKRVNTALTDAYITAKVEAAVLKAKVFDDESIPLVGINASTINGIVTLSGHLKNTRSLDTILKRADAVRGVKKIISNLQIDKTA